MNQPRQRLLYGIERTCTPEYREAVAHDKFGTTNLESLDTERLRQLLITLKNRRCESCLKATVASSV
jgi:hypothetical protein